MSNFCLVMEGSFLIGKFYFDSQARYFKFSVLEDPDNFYQVAYEHDQINAWVMRVMHCFREKTPFSFRYNTETKEVVELW